MTNLHKALIALAAVWGCSAAAAVSVSGCGSSSSTQPPSEAGTDGAGDSTVDVGNLHIGALVEVDINGVPTQFTAAATHKTFSVSTLTAGVVVTARQGLCNPPVWSNPSTAATVGVTGLIPPICVSPPDKIHNEMLTPPLEWEYLPKNCESPTTYFDIEVSTDPTFPILAFSKYNYDTASNQITVMPALKHNTTYFWRVRGRLPGVSPGPWVATPFRFTTMG